jgi:hypothetical protein
MEMRMALKEVGSLGFSNKLNTLSKGILLRYQPVTIHVYSTPRCLPDQCLHEGYRRSKTLTRTFLRVAHPVARPLPQATRRLALSSGVL